MIRQVLREMENVKGRKVLLQVPEGLKHRVDAIVDRLREQGNEVYVCIDPCFGACDVRIREAEQIGADTIVHVGHTPFPGTPAGVAVRYVEVRLPVNVEAVLRALNKVDGKIALCTTVQYVHALEEIKKSLPGRVFYGKGALTKYPGQILGCDASACDVDADANVFLGDGLFHAVAMYMTRRRRTYIVSPCGELKDVTKECERFCRAREGLKAIAYEAERWGIVVSTKPGQFRPDTARRVQRAAEEAGKKADVLVCDYFFPEYSRGMPYGAYVFTGCPRVALDDWKNYDRPVLTVAEALEVIEWLKSVKKK